MKKVTTKKLSPKNKRVTTNKKSYLEYIKAHKNRIITSGILGAGILAAGVYYIKFTTKNIARINKKTVQEIRDITKDPEFKENIKEVGAGIATKVIDEYVERGTEKIASTVNSIGGTGVKAIEVYEDTLANLALPTGVPIKKETIDAIIIKNVIEEMDSKRIIQIEKYLLSINKIRNGCSSETLQLPGAFPCSPEEKELAIKDILEYYKNEELFKQVLDFIETEFIKEAEKNLINEKKINPNCTKYNKEFAPYWLSILSSGPCQDQELADSLIQEAVKFLKLNS